MKFVKALNQGIVTDLGLGNHVYNITMEGCEVEDSVASKLKEVFGHLISISTLDGDVPVENVIEVTSGQLQSEGANLEVVADSVEVSSIDEIVKNEETVSFEPVDFDESVVADSVEA